MKLQIINKNNIIKKKSNVSDHTKKNLKNTFKFFFNYYYYYYYFHVRVVGLCDGAG